MPYYPNLEVFYSHRGLSVKSMVFLCQMSVNVYVSVNAHPELTCQICFKGLVALSSTIVDHGFIFNGS